MSAKLNLLSDFFLNRFQTVSIYKEIVHLSESVGYNAVNLKLTEKNEAATQSYQLQITMPMNSLIAPPLHLDWLVGSQVLAFTALNGTTTP